MILQIIQRKAANLYLVLPLIALITFMGYETKANPMSVTYSSEELFKGIFFAEGPVATHIPELEGLHISNFITDGAQLRNAVQFQHSIYEEVRRANNAVIDGLTSAVNSKNLVQIERAIEQATDAMLTAVNTLTSEDVRAAVENEVAVMDASIGQEMGEGSTQEDFDQAVKNYLRGMFSSKANADYQALLLYLVAVFAIAVYAAFYYYKVSKTKTVSAMYGQDNDLYKEQLILSISKL
jgi:SdpC family antimicrobial peptide